MQECKLKQLLLKVAKLNIYYHFRTDAVWKFKCETDGTCAWEQVTTLQKGRTSFAAIPIPEPEVQETQQAVDEDAEVDFGNTLDWTLQIQKRILDQ